MPDIREPYPVKPVWPTRPGRKIAEKKVPKSEKDKDKKKKKQQQDNERPHIDDYA
jgi:hypothetical protein